MCVVMIRLQIDMPEKYKFKEFIAIYCSNSVECCALKEFISRDVYQFKLRELCILDHSIRIEKF